MYLHKSFGSCLAARILLDSPACSWPCRPLRTPASGVYWSFIGAVLESIDLYQPTGSLPGQVACRGPHFVRIAGTRRGPQQRHKDGNFVLIVLGRLGSPWQCCCGFSFAVVSTKYSSSNPACTSGPVQRQDLEVEQCRRRSRVGKGSRCSVHRGGERVLSVPGLGLEGRSTGERAWMEYDAPLASAGLRCVNFSAQHDTGRHCPSGPGSAGDHHSDCF